MALPTSDIVDGHDSAVTRGRSQQRRYGALGPVSLVGASTAAFSPT